MGGGLDPVADDIDDDEYLMVVVDHVAIEPVSADQRSALSDQKLPAQRERRQQLRFRQERVLKGVGDAPLRREQRGLGQGERCHVGERPEEVLLRFVEALDVTEGHHEHSLCARHPERNDGP